jgi:hypothetical protein
MRTVLFLSAGILLLVAFYVLARLFSEHYPNAPNVALIFYVVVWLLIAASNMWVGVAKAGYSAAEELPIFLVIFGVPLAIAVVVKWKFL